MFRLFTLTEQLESSGVGGLKATAAIAASVWTNVAVTQYGGSYTFYSDGATNGTSTITDIPDNSAEPTSLARRNYLGYEEYYIGILNEIRLSSIVRSANWEALTNLSNRDQLSTWASASPTVSVLQTLEQGYSLTLDINGILDQLYSLTSDVGLAFLEQIYGLRTSQSLKQVYALTFDILQALNQIYGLKESVSLVQYYGDALTLNSVLKQYYGDAALVQVAIEQKYGDALQLYAQLDQPYTYPKALQSILEQKYSISSVSLLSISEQMYTLNANNFLRGNLDQIYAILGGITQELSYNISVTIGGRIVQVSHINIEGSQDQYCLSCELHLGTQSDFVQSNVLDDVVVTIGSDVFYFFVEAKKRRRGYATAEYIITGLSKTALLDAPYAHTISGELTGLASEIVSSLAVGYTVNWQTVDWFIPPQTLMPANQTPLQIIHDITEAAGAIIQTELDGVITIEPLYPVSVPDWEQSTVYYGMSDALDFFTVGENFEHRLGYNKYLISDQLTSKDTIKLEEEGITSSRKYVRVYQTPWKNDFTLRHTGGTWVILESLGIEERVITDEIVEFVSGTGTTQYPIYSRISIEWLQDNLGNITFGEDGILESDIKAESLLKISYKTKCRKYLAADTKIEPVQMVAEKKTE